MAIVGRLLGSVDCRYM